MAMERVSITQALDVWSDLARAYYGEAAYGGDVAEIYAYRLAPYCPTLHSPERSGQFPIHGDRAAAVRFRAQTGAALVEMVQWFCDEFDCDATVDDVPLRRWIQRADTAGSFELGHRCHVRIIRGEATR